MRNTASLAMLLAIGLCGIVAAGLGWAVLRPDRTAREA